MDTEHMREVLARGLGWTFDEAGFHDCGGFWVGPDNMTVMTLEHWRPDEKPEQMVKVIDSLDKDWFLHVWIDEGGQGWTCEAAHGDFKEFGFGKFCEAICMAIACVKEMEVADACQRKRSIHAQED